MLTRYQKLHPFLRTFTLPLALVLSQAAVTTAMAGSCVATSSGAASCAIPAGVNTVAVVATGAGGGGGAVGVGGNGGVVTATLTGVSGATLGLYVGGGGSGSTQGGGGGGGSSNVSMNGSVQIVAGGGGGGGFGSGYGSDAGSNGNGGRTDFYSGAGGNGGVSGYGVNGGQPGGSGAGGAGGSGCGPTGATGAGGGGGSGSGAGFGGAGGDQFSSGAFGGGGGGGGGHGGGGGGGSGGGGGGGGGSVGGTLSVASNGGAARQGGADGSILVTWSDAGPVASDVRINGVPQLGAVLTGSYTYSSAAGAAQGNSVFRWMSDTNSDGQSKRPIGGATSTTYSPTLAEGGNYLFFCVTPVAQTGTLTGNEACSIGVPFTLLAPSQASTNVLGIGPNKVAPLDLNTGFGPTLTGCLTDAVRQFLGKDAQYAGQTSGGSARMAQGGGVISFYALNASGNASEGQGLRLLASNALTVRTACGSLDVAPALFNPAEVGLTVAALGLSASIDATGLLVVAGNGNVYVMRPDYQVLPGSAPGAGLQKDTDGNYRFVDSKGYGQVLRAAFLSPSTLQALAGSALGGTIVIQTDGTALLTAFDGSQSVLEPDLALGAIPQAHAQSNWWADGPNRFRYVFGLYSQGLTVRAK